MHTIGFVKFFLINKCLIKHFVIGKLFFLRIRNFFNDLCHRTGSSSQCNTGTTVQQFHCTPKKKCFPNDFLAKSFFFKQTKRLKSSFYFFSNSKMMSWRVFSDREIKKFRLKSSWWRCVEAELPSFELDEFPKLCKIRCILEDYHQIFHNCSSNRSNVIKRHWIKVLTTLLIPD
jgi:hypothetical protein